MIIFLQSTQYIFHWKGTLLPPGGQEEFCESNEIGFVSTMQTVLFLRKFNQIESFRRLLSERFPGQVYRWPSAEVYAKLADLLVKQQLSVLKRWPRAKGAPVVEQSARPVRVERQETTEKQGPTDPPTFLSNHDDDAQAATLIQASALGVPFCEECSRAE